MRISVNDLPTMDSPAGSSSAHRARIYAAMKRSCRGAMLIVALCGCEGAVRVPASAQRSAPPGHTVHGWVTTADRSQQLVRLDLVLNHATASPATIEIDTTRRYQTMVGFGAAITDAAAGLIRFRMNGAQR